MISRMACRNRLDPARSGVAASDRLAVSVRWGRLGRAVGGTLSRRSASNPNPNPSCCGTGRGHWPGPPAFFRCLRPSAHRQPSAHGGAHAISRLHADPRGRLLAPQTSEKKEGRAGCTNSGYSPGWRCWPVSRLVATPRPNRRFTVPGRGCSAHTSLTATRLSAPPRVLRATWSIASNSPTSAAERGPGCAAFGAARHGCIATAAPEPCADLASIAPQGRKRPAVYPARQNEPFMQDRPGAIRGGLSRSTTP